MNDLMIFEGNQVEIILNEKGEPLFEIYSTGMALGHIKYNGVGKAYPRKERIDKDIENAEISICVQDGHKYFTEEQLYDFMLEVHTDKCKKFKKWITHEVLPKIRKTGGYIPTNEDMTDEEIMAKALLVAQKTIKNKNELIESQNKRIEEMKPKEIFADAVSTSTDTILVGKLAKILRQNGINIGQNRLFKWLRDNGYLIKRNGADYNMPTQYSMDLGLFKIKETAITHSDGHVTINKTPKVTGKGQHYFINKYLTQGAI